MVVQTEQMKEIYQISLHDLRNISSEYLLSDGWKIHFRWQKDQYLYCSVYLLSILSCGLLAQSFVVALFNRRQIAKKLPL